MMSSLGEVAMMRLILRVRLLVVALFVLPCAALEVPAPRVVDLTAADGT